MGSMGYSKNIAPAKDFGLRSSQGVCNISSIDGLLKATGLCIIWESQRYIKSNWMYWAACGKGKY